MSEQERPQIYLVTPPDLSLETFPAQLAAMLDAHEIAVVRLALASRDEDHVARVADALRLVCHERDIALVIDEHVQLVERLGLDGVHLLDGARSVRKLRKELGSEAIVGSSCGTSRHDGMSAGEAGADYVAFGPAGATSLGGGDQAETELFQWWSEMIEVPVVAEGAIGIEDVRRLAPFTDFFAIGEEVWRAEDPVAAMGALIDAMR